MKKTLTLGAIAVGIISTPALAQSGLYVGAIAGYEGITVNSADSSITADAGSAVYGVTAGYDLGLGNAFVGVEGELSTSGGSTKFPNNFSGARDSLNANGQYYVGARAGVALTSGISAYGKLGYTSLSTTAFTSSGSLNELKQNATGVRYGAGLQVQLPGPFEARVEYRRSRYNDVNDGTYGAATTNQVVAGLGLRF
jgi:outer membrane immunogenic protein